jgi:homocysteine S-methyltransferase
MISPQTHRSQIDLVCFETVPCAKEVEAICNLLSNTPALQRVHAWVSCSCADAVHTCHGEPFALQVVPLLCACKQVVGVGVNCTSPAHISQLMQAARHAIVAASTASAPPTNSPSGATPATTPPVLLCYPNSGEAWDGAAQCWAGDPCGLSPPDAFADAARGWVAAGAQAVGGCCRTSTQHIAALRAALLPAADT